MLDKVSQSAAPTDEGWRRTATKSNGTNDGRFPTAIPSKNEVDFWTRFLNNVVVSPETGEKKQNNGGIQRKYD
jgi:hypothetical protein